MLGWIDIDADASRRALELLKRLDAKGSIDQLGLGVLRDRMADILHPATSTLMTHARYFVLIPRAFRAIEKEVGRRPHSLAGLHSLLAQKEMEQAHKLIAKAKEAYNGKLDGSGIIGWDKLENGRGWVVQTPSSNYWSSIRKLGLFSHDLTIDEYLKALTRGDFRVLKSGDATADRERTLHTWDENIPDLDGKDVRLELTENEAKYLLKRFTESGMTKASFMAAVIRDKAPKSRRDFSHPWEHPASERAEFRELISQAKALSGLMVGANRTYNLLLANKDGGRALVNKAKEDWEAWLNAAGSEPGRKDAIKTDFTKLKVYLPDHNSHLLIQRALSFLASFQKHVAASTSLAAIQKADCASLIRTQEISAKGKPYAKLARAKKSSGSENVSADQSLGGRSAPDFRWGIAKEVTCDLYRLPKAI